VFGEFPELKFLSSSGDARQRNLVQRFFTSDRQQPQGDVPQEVLKIGMVQNDDGSKNLLRGFLVGLGRRGNELHTSLQALADLLHVGLEVCFGGFREIALHELLNPLGSLLRGHLIGHVTIVNLGSCRKVFVESERRTYHSPSEHYKEGTCDGGLATHLGGPLHLRHHHRYSVESLKGDVAFRRLTTERAGLGFTLPDRFAPLAPRM
jgi:hypothetical protein